MKIGYDRTWLEEEREDRVRQVEALETMAAVMGDILDLLKDRPLLGVAARKEIVG